MTTLAKLSSEYPNLAASLRRRSILELLTILNGLRRMRRRWGFFDGRFETLERLAIADLENRTGYPPIYFN